MATKKVYLNTIAQIGGKIMTALISIFLIKIVTNYLDVAGYGLYSKIYNYLSIFAVIADLGLYTITVREISDNKDDREKVEKIVGNVLTMRTLFGLVIIVLSLAIGYFLPGYNSPMALAGILLAGVFTLFGLINSSVMSLLQAYLRTEFSFISTTVGKVVNFAAILLIAFVLLPRTTMSGDPTLEFWGFVAIMTAWLLGNIVMAGMLYTYAKRIKFIHSPRPLGEGSGVRADADEAESEGRISPFIWISFHFDLEYMKHMLRMSLPYGLALFLNVIYFKVDVILLSVLEPRAIADTNIALYSVPMKIVEVGMMFGTLFLNSMLPLFTEAIKEGQAKKNKPPVSPLSGGQNSTPLTRGDESAAADEGGLINNPKLLSHISKAYRILLVFGVGIAFFFFTNAHEVVAMLASHDYLTPSTLHPYTSLDAMRIVVFIFLFFFLSSLFTYLLIAAGEQKKLLRINAIITVANLVGNLAIIPFYSFVGSAWVTLICQILLLAQTYWTTRHIARFGFLPSFTAITLALAVLASGINMLVLSRLHTDTLVTFTISIMIFSLIYLGGIIAILGRQYLVAEKKMVL